MDKVPYTLATVTSKLEEGEQLGSKGVTLGGD